MTFRRLLLLAAAVGAGALAISTAARYFTLTSAILGGSLYAVAALLLAGAGAVLARDPVRGRLLAVGGAIILASWVAAIGYGGSEDATRAVAVLGVIGAIAPLVGAPPRWAVLGLGVLVLACVPLIYLTFVHPPLALVAIDAVAGVGISSAVLSLLPAPAQRWPLPAIAVIALVAWLLGTLALLVAFGLPLISS